jgi:hypothetical protein
MRTQARAALAALILSVVGSGCGGAATGTPATTPADTPATSPAPATKEVTVQEGPIEAGTYRLPKSVYSAVDYTITIPEDWSVQYGHVFHKHPDSPAELSISSTVVDSIYADACSGSGSQVVGVGPTIDDLAKALHKQSGPIVSDPVAATLGGLPASQINLTVPKGFDLAPCDVKDIGLRVWHTTPADDNLVLFPETPATLTLVNVDGQRQVFVTMHSTATSAEDLRELQAVLDSIQFET